MVALGGHPQRAIADARQVVDDADDGALPARDGGAEAREEEVDGPVVDQVEARIADEDAGGIFAFGGAHALEDLAVEAVAATETVVVVHAQRLEVALLQVRTPADERDDLQLLELEARGLERAELGEELRQIEDAEPDVARFV